MFKKIIVFVLIISSIYFGLNVFSNNTKADDSLFIGDGTYIFTQNQRVQLNTGTIIEPIYNTTGQNCIMDVPCLSFKVYDANSIYIGQTIGNTRLTPQDLSVGGYRFTATVHNMNSNNGIWTASITLAGVNEAQCISWTYSNWSTCTNGTQSRTIISSYPTGCTGGIPYTTQSCISGPTYVGDGTYTIHQWETIKLNNQVILEPVFDRPLNVYFISFKVFEENTPTQIGTVYPIRVGTTSPIDTTAGNYRFRVVLNSLNYNNDTWSASVTFTSLYEPQCTSFTYSDWSYCYNNQQWRTILTSSPANCIAGNPITTQSCASSQYNGDGTYTVRSGEKIHLNNGAYISPSYIQNSQTGNEVILDVLDNNQTPLGIAPQIMVNDPPRDFTVGGYRFRASASSAGIQNGVWTTTITLLSLNESSTCTSWSYSNWSTCTNGQQIRTITTSSPSGCTGGNPITTQSCNTNSNTISNVQIQTTQNSAKITWNSYIDDISYLLWGIKNTENDINTVVRNDVKTKNHELIINNLLLNTTYYFQISSKINTGNLVMSNVYSFTTLANESSSQLIYNLQIQTTQNSAKITWNSNEDDQSYLLYGTKNTNDDIGTVSKDDDFTKNHELFLDHLNPNTTYYFRIYSNRSTSNMIESETFSFTTRKQIINADKTLSNKLKGKLLLDVEDKGRIWYINPSDAQKYEITFGNAMSLFKRFSLGISNKNLNEISEIKSTVLGNKLKGKLLLQVEDRGRIWYIDQNSLKHEVTWTNLMDLFRRLSLGINKANLDKIQYGTIE